MPKNVQTNIELHSFHMLVKLWSKSFKQYMNWELPELEKAEEVFWFKLED